MAKELKQLSPKQENALYYLKDNTTEEVLYGGAAGGGKSALGCLWLMEMCQRYPGSRWLMGRSKLKTLEETTLNTFFELAALANLTNQFRYNKQKYIIYWHNGSQILLKDLFSYPSDPEFDKLGSLEITGAFIDECNQISYKAWQIVKSRIRYKVEENSLKEKMLGTCNPAKNWTYKEFYSPSKNNKLKPIRKFIQALPKDNPNLSESYRKILLGLDNNSKERLYNGNWEYDDDPATLIDMDSILSYFKPTHLKGEGQKYMTIDVARKGRDKTIFRIWHGWLCIKRVAIAKSGLDVVVEKAKELQKEHGVPITNVIADEDGVGGGVVDFLKCKGFVNNSKPIEVREGGKMIVPNFDNLKSQCSIKMAEKICAKQVGEICKDADVADTTAEEMEQIKLKDIDKDGKQGIVPKDKMKEILNRSPDDWDSIMMRYWFELKPTGRAEVVIF